MPPNQPGTPPSPAEEAVGPAGRRVPGPRRPVSQPVARRGRRVAAPAGLAPGPGRRRARELGGGGEGARRLRSRSPARGSRASGRARTHLHTPRSGRARAAGAPARTAADSCCSSAAARQPGARGRGGRGGRAGGEAKRGASRGSCVRAGAELAWLPGCAAGWPAAALARRRLSGSFPLPPPDSAATLASAGGFGDGGELFPRGWLLGRGSDCP